MLDFNKLAHNIKLWAKELGFDQAGITDIDLSAYTQDLQLFLEKGFHGSMQYLQAHADKRAHPEQLVPGTVRIISLRMNYLPADTHAIANLKNSQKAYIARYALGKDYHKFLRKKLENLAQKINAQIGTFGYRAFADSAPVLEKPLGEKAGLGWIGKNTLLINDKEGSWFFLAELFTDLPLPLDNNPMPDNCGKCTACIQICPTQAIIAPYQMDARKCISYLTIENKDSIPLEFRKLIGNRVFGCDDCQLICPWNRYAQTAKEIHFDPKQAFVQQDLLTLFLWDEATFVQNTLGSAIKRIGYKGWLRNLAVALGNAPRQIEIIEALHSRLEQADEMLKEHILWALEQQEKNVVNIDRKLQKLTTKLNKNY